MAAFALIPGVTSLLGGIFGSAAAEKAAQQQVTGITNAANFVKQQQATGLGTIQQNLAGQQKLLAPYQALGGQALTNLSNLAGTPGQGLLAPWTGQFQAPTAEQAAATPGYQFQLQQAMEQAQNSAAGRGGLLTGGTQKALDQYAQGIASENYGNVYNRAFNEYQQNYNQFLTNQANQFGRLSSLAGVGEWGTGAGVNALGQATGQTLGLLGQTSGMVNQDYTNIGSAQAAGTIGAQNAWNSALSGIGNAASTYGVLSSLGGSPSAAPTGGAIGGPGTPLWQPSYMPASPPTISGGGTPLSTLAGMNPAIFSGVGAQPFNASGYSPPASTPSYLNPSQIWGGG